MQTGHALFIHELADMLDGERRLVDALGELASDSSNGQLRKAFETHRKQTQKHVERIEQCFEVLGERPPAGECAGIRGLIEEKQTFMKEDPSDDLVDVFDAGAAVKTESYEINAYEGMIRMARAMKHSQVARLLEQNLKEEETALRKMETFSKKLKPARMMSAEEAERARMKSASRRKRAA
jgi:ferritin-like metal-binding protein YciE